MTEALAARLVHSPIGPVGLSWGEHGLRAVVLPRASEAATVRALRERCGAGATADAARHEADVGEQGSSAAAFGPSRSSGGASSAAAWHEAHVGQQDAGRS